MEQSEIGIAFFSKLLGESTIYKTKHTEVKEAP